MPCSLLSRPPAAADRKGAAERPEGTMPGADSMAVLPLCVYREPALVAAAKMVWFDAIPKLSFAESLLAVLCKEHIFRADEQPTEEY